MLAGIFVGGRGARMGEVPKGLLVGPRGVTLVEHIAGCCARAGMTVVRVGAHPAYEHLPWELVRDRPEHIGPLGGLGGLLALGAARGERQVWAFSCDLPGLDDALVRALRDAPDEAPVCCPRGERYDPLVARYRVVEGLSAVERWAASGRRDLQGLVEGLGVQVLPVEDRRVLRDWDAPEDLAREDIALRLHYGQR